MDTSVSTFNNIVSLYLAPIAFTQIDFKMALNLEIRSSERAHA